MTENTYTAADFEGHLIAHKGDHIALRTHDDDAPWTLFLIRRDHFMSPAPVCSSQRWLADNGWIPGPPPRNGDEQDVRERDETIKEQRAVIEDLREAVWKRGEIIGDLREDLAADQARIPSTSEEALALVWELAHEVPEGQLIPAGTPYIVRYDGEVIHVAPEGSEFDKPSGLGTVERRTLTPLPAPRPRHAEVIERELDVCIGGDDNEDLADTIARAIEEQETDDE